MTAERNFTDLHKESEAGNNGAHGVIETTSLLKIRYTLKILIKRIDDLSSIEEQTDKALIHDELLVYIDEN